MIVYHLISRNFIWCIRNKNIICCVFFVAVVVEFEKILNLIRNRKRWVEKMDGHVEEIADGRDQK